LAQLCVRLGRAPDNDIVLEDLFASRQHAEIVWRDGRYLVRDLGSKNGVLVDGVRVDEISLDDGCLLQLAGAQFRFHDPASTMTQPAVIAVSRRGLWVDPERREVSVDGQLLDPPLSPTQFDLLLFLWRARGQAISKDAIAAHVWAKADGAVYDSSIDRMISRLRTRLGDRGETPRFIHTVRGFGFRLEAGSE
jgi:DNA-binding winged helix-turn-helix (wHTH) protein